MPQPIVDAASATASITEDDATLEAMLDEAHIPALMAALVHITGDANIIRGEIRPSGALFGDQQAGISAEHQAEIRTLALQKLAEFRDNGCKLPGGAPSLGRKVVSWKRPCSSSWPVAGRLEVPSAT